MIMMMMISKIKTVNKSEIYLPYKNAEPANFHWPGSRRSLSCWSGSGVGRE